MGWARKRPANQRKHGYKRTQPRVARVEGCCTKSAEGIRPEAAMAKNGKGAGKVTASFFSTGEEAGLA